MALQHRFVIGQGHGLRAKAHLLPGEDILLLRRRGGPVPQLQRLHILGQDPLALGVGPEIGIRRRLGVDPHAGPGVALLFDLLHAGAAALAESALHPLYTVAHQQIDHALRQAQIVRQSQQDPHVRGGQLFAQLHLHLPGEGLERLAVL